MENIVILKIIDFLKFMRKFLWKSDKDHNRNGDAKLCKINRKNSIWKIWKFVSRSYENYTYLPRESKNFKNSCSFYETLGFRNSCLSFDPS